MCIRDSLKAEVVAMREKMRAAQHKVVGQFDIKQSIGGIIDVEFLVQYLVLAHAKQYPQLTGNIGNIGLLKLMAKLSIIEAKLAESVASAYREYRHAQHRLKLQGAIQLTVDLPPIARQAEEVTRLWNEVFAN